MITWPSVFAFLGLGGACVLGLKEMKRAKDESEYTKAFLVIVFNIRCLDEPFYLITRFSSKTPSGYRPARFGW